MASAGEAEQPESFPRISSLMGGIQRAQPAQPGVVRYYLSMERKYSREGTPMTLGRYELVDGVLTPRQRQIVGLFCGGWTANQIADSLGLSVQTINPSLRQASRRMGAIGIARATLLERARATGNLDVVAAP